MQHAREQQFGPCRVNLETEQLWHGVEERGLRPKTFAVLRYLIAHPHRVVSKEELLEAIWPTLAVSEAVLTVCVGELRKALGDDPQHPQFVKTVHGRGYRFIGALEVPEALDSSSPRIMVSRDQTEASASLVHMVGRERELKRLQGWLAQAQRGARHVVFVTGEPGIGKTTLVDIFLAGAVTTGPLWIAQGQCIEHYGAGEAYLPVLDALGQLCRGPEGRRVVEVLSQQAPTWLVQMPALLRAADLETVHRRVQGATRERMLRELAEALEVLTVETPLVLVLEDLHWSDDATLDLVSWLARRRAPARLVLLGTYRPVEVIMRGHPLQAVTQDLALHRQCEILPLELLTEAEVAQYLATRSGEGIVQDGLARLVYQSTDGYPLFMALVVDDLLRQDAGEAESWTVPLGHETKVIGVPRSLRQLIGQQLNELHEEARQVLEAASVAGVEFSTAAVAAGLETTVTMVEAQCDRLAQQGRFLHVGGLETWPDGTVVGCYRFRHAFQQQMVYEGLSAGQRMRLHQRIGVWEERASGTQAGARAAALARHFCQGYDEQRAVHYLQRAADNALQRYAYQEAINHLTSGLEVLRRWPDTPERTRYELAFQVALGSASIATKGQAAPEVEHAYLRARTLCQQLGETPQLFAVLRGLRRFYSGRAQHRMAWELGKELLSWAQHAQDPMLLPEANYSVGLPAYQLGELVFARESLEQGSALYDVQQHRSYVFRYGQDPGVLCLSYGAMILGLLGYPAQALQRSQAALTLAQELAHPFSQVVARVWAARVHKFRREVHAAQHHAEAAVALATEPEFPYWLAQGTILGGWALAGRGQGAQGIAQMCQGLATLRATRTESGLAYYLTLLAEGYAAIGQAEQALSALAEALAAAHTTEERVHEAEICRLQGELLLQTGGHRLRSGRQAEAETCFRQALRVARRQQAKSLELRAALSLARLWRQQGKQAEARALLAPIYGWFTEGFDTADLQEAKVLLEDLS